MSGAGRLELFLDSRVAWPGGMVRGHAVLTGGASPRRLVELTVRILVVFESRRLHDAGPRMGARQVAKQVVVTNAYVSPEASKTFAFRLPVPVNIKPSGCRATFQVVAWADIAGAEGPSARVDLTVVRAGPDDEPVSPSMEALRDFFHSAEADDMGDDRDDDDRSEADATIVMDRPLDGWPDVGDDGCDSGKMAILVLAVCERHLQNPDVSVRAEIARSLRHQPRGAFERIWAIARHLAADPDERVRRALALAFVDMGELPQLLPIAEHLATQDPSVTVRRAARLGLSGLLQPH